MIKDKRIFLLAGLPRTGSTLLGSILNQHPDVQVTPTSPLYSLLVNVNEHFNLLRLQYTFDEPVLSAKVYRSIVESFYGTCPKHNIFDKHRGWPKHIPAIREFININPRIVCTIRPIAEVITSYLVLALRDPDNFIDKHLKRDGEALTNESRANLLWRSYLKEPYESLTIGLRDHRECILLIKYDDIVFRPRQVLSMLYSFCGIQPFQRHNFETIENTCAEAKDEAWGMRNLHTIRPELDRQSADPLDYLPFDAVQYFSQFDIGTKANVGFAGMVAND